MEQNLKTAQELAEVLNVAVTWVWRAARLGLIPCIRVGKYMRFDLQAVLVALAEG